MPCSVLGMRPVFAHPLLRHLSDICPLYTLGRKSLAWFALEPVSLNAQTLHGGFQRCLGTLPPTPFPQLAQTLPYTQLFPSCGYHLVST